MTGVGRGVAVLRAILREETFDLRELRDVAEFRRWLACHLRRWRRDPVFAARVRIRNVRRSTPELAALEREHRRAARLDAASETSGRLRRVERALADAEKAVAGLAEAAGRAAGRRRADLLRKRSEFLARREALAAERADLARSSPERRRLDDVAERLRRLRSATGLEAEEAALARRLTARGRRGGRSGAEFERTVAEVIRDAVLPEVTPAGIAGDVALLRGVTLGAARVEFDLLAVRRMRRGPVEVLAAVEAKRNINDLAHGFRRRQEDLAWLTGEVPDSAAASFRTKTFPAGRFDREVIHRQEGAEFVFGPGSFRRFRRDVRSGLFLDRLYLVTRRGPVWGVSSAALSRVAFRAATDDRWDLRDGAFVTDLFAWCRSLAGPFETPDVLRLYAAGPRRAGRLIVLGRP